jgi:hypothetical protein
MAQTVDQVAAANPRSAEPTESPPINGRSTSPGHATRYICAAMHLDRKLTNQVLSELLEDDHHAFGPADGVDLGLMTPVPSRSTANRSRTCGVPALQPIGPVRALSSVNGSGASDDGVTPVSSCDQPSASSRRQEPRHSLRGRRPSCGRPESKAVRPGSPRGSSSLHRNCGSPNSPPRVCPTRRSALSSSSVRTPSPTTYGRSSRSSACGPGTRWLTSFGQSRCQPVTWIHLHIATQNSCVDPRPPRAGGGRCHLHDGVDPLRRHGGTSTRLTSAYELDWTGA